MRHGPLAGDLRNRCRTGHRRSPGRPDHARQRDRGRTQPGTDGRRTRESRMRRRRLAASEIPEQDGHLTVPPADATPPAPQARLNQALFDQHALVFRHHRRAPPPLPGPQSSDCPCHDKRCARRRPRPAHRCEPFRWHTCAGITGAPGPISQTARHTWGVPGRAPDVALHPACSTPPTRWRRRGRRRTDCWRRTGCWRRTARPCAAMTPELREGDAGRQGDHIAHDLQPQNRPTPHHPGPDGTG